MTTYDWDVLELAAGISHMAPGKDPPVRRPHGMRGWILNATVSGRGVINRGGDRFTAGRGDLLLWAPEVVHDYGFDPTAGHWEHAWVYFTPALHWRDLLNWPLGPDGVRILSVGAGTAYEGVLERFSELVDIASVDHPLRARRVLNAVEGLLLQCRTCCGETGLSIDERIQVVLDHLTHSLAQRHDVSSLARRAGLSESRFAHLFKEITGFAPMAYLERQRINRAREMLLMTTKSVGAVSDEVGFGNAFYFSRVFRKLTGMSPRKFRQRTEI